MDASIYLVLSMALLAAGDRPQDSRKELERFEGTWVLIDGEKEGQKLPADQIKKGKITWHRGQVSVDTPHQSPDTIQATITVDPSQSPKHMDWVRSTGPGKDETFHAIYEFISDDEYRVCFSPAGKDRPREFATKPGNGQLLHVWKRVKP